MKAFLSHSSDDKIYVSKVFEYLSASRAHYDSVTFESFQRSHDAIQAALKDSDVFVFFASPQSLSSPWVQEEVKLAVDPASLGKRLERVVVLLGADRSALPPELRQFTSISYADPGLVARKIEDLLIQLHSLNSPLKPFVGREDDLKVIGAGMTPVGSRPPDFIYVAGLSGVSRKTVLLRSIKDNYPFINQSLRIIAVSKGAGFSDLYFSIRSSIKVGTIGEYVNEIEKFTDLDEANQAGALVSLIGEATKDRDPIVLDDAAWLMTDNGEMATWFVEILEALPERSFPQVFLVSSRALSTSGRASLGSRFFGHVLHSLSRPNSLRLLRLLFQQVELSIDSTAVDSLIDVVDGHPDQIVRAARLIITGRQSGADLRTREIIEALNRSSESLISLANLSATQFVIIKLFNEFEYMSGEDLATAFEMADDFELALFGLLDLCFVERVGHFLRLAPSISRALVRMADNHANLGAFVASRLKVAERLNVISSDDLVHFEVLENAVAAWVRSSQLDPPLKLARMLLPASLLRCAQRAYDFRDWRDAADFSSRALDGDWKLTVEASMEAYRLRGLSLARLGEDVAFDELVFSLKSSDRFAGKARNSSRRLEHFLVAFKARLDGEYELARKELEQIIAVHRKPNFSVLREYSHVLVKLGELDAAMGFARQALDMASSNPFVLSMLIDIIDKISIQNGMSSAMAAERRELFDRLRRADDSERTSFSILRESRELAREKDYEGALKLLARAESDRQSDPIVVGIERARILLMKGSFEKAVMEAEKVRKQAVNSLGKRAVEYFAEVDEIKIRGLAEQGHVTQAEQLLGEARRIDKSTRLDLERLLGFAKARH